MFQLANYFFKFEYGCWWTCAYPGALAGERYCVGFCGCPPWKTPGGIYPGGWVGPRWYPPWLPPPGGKPPPWGGGAVESEKPARHICGQPTTKSMATAATTSAASQLSPSCVACIERHRIQLGNDLVEGTMGGLLVGFNGCQLLRITMVSGGSTGSCHLTLVRQSSNLASHPFHYQFFVIVAICRKRSECILLRECRGIPMMPSCGHFCIKVVLKGLLY